MIIKSIELQNFRNYEDLNISFDEGTNIFYGDNAQGKTNILEAAYLSGTTKSHKCSKDKEMIRFGEQESHIRTVVVKKEKEYQIDMHLKHNRSKGIAINKVPIKKASELFGILNMVFFSPEDLNIIKNGPGERRRFMDAELCQLDKLYLTDLAGYNHVLNQRNKLLKDMYKQPDLGATLDVWDMQLAEYGSKVIKRREQFIKDINKIIKPIHRKLTENSEEIEVVYKKSCNEDELYNKIIENRKKDIKLKSTSAGPHRDDILFFNKDINIRTYGSQGQKRTVALSLKLAEIELVKSLINDTPVLLLDDVLSELDSDRQNHLLKSLDEIQTVITCTGLDEFIENRFSINKVFQVTKGKIEERTV
mgnify:CR=1 FL=1